MASDDLDQDLDIPQIAIVGLLSDNPLLSAPSRPSPLLDSSRLPPSPSPTDNHGSSPLSSLTPIRRSVRNSLDTFGCPSHASDNSSLPTTTSPTFSAPRSAQSFASSSDSTQWASSTILVRESRPEEHNGAPPRCSHRRKGSATSSIGRRSETRAPARGPLFLYNNMRSRAAHSDKTTGLVPASLDAGSSAGWRPSSVTSFFKRTVRRVRRTSGESDTSSDAMRNGGQKGDNADVRQLRLKGAQLAPPVLLDLKQEAGLDSFQKASVVLDMEERLEATKKLHDDAVDLKKFYESGTVAAIQDLRTTGIPRPLPQDSAVFREVDSLLAEIQRFYGELNEFWKVEIHHVAKALKEARTDPRDFERWNTFHSSLRHTIEFWKNRPPESDAQTLRSNNMPSSSTGIDLGAIAASLSSTMGYLEDALERMSSSTSLRYSQLGRPSFQRLYIAFAGNSDICFSFLRLCVDYGESVLAWRLVSTSSPTSSRVGASGSHDLRERTTVLRSEVTSVSAKGFAGLEGVSALLPGRTHHGLSAGTPLAHHASPDPTLQNFTVFQGMNKDPAKPVITIIPPVGVTAELIEDRQRILDQNFLQRPSQTRSLLQIMWLTLKEKVLVLLSIYAIVSLSLSIFKLGTTLSPGVPR